MKKNLQSAPPPPHQQRSETEEKKWFSQCSKTGQCKAPQESTQLCAHWHKSSQANRNVWLGEVQAKPWESGGLTHPTAQPALPAQFYSSIFPYHVSSEDSVLMKRKTNISGKNRCQKLRVTSPGTSLLQEAPPSLPLPSACGVKGSDASWTEHHIHKLQCQSGLGWTSGQLNL